MQLRQAEALGVENDHDRGIWHVHAHLNDCCCHENLCFATDKALHFLLLVGGFHLTMHLTHAKLREHFSQRSEAVFQVFQVYLLAFLNKWEHDVDLSALMNLLADSLIERHHLVVVLMDGHHRLTSGRQLVDDTDVQVAVYGHRQRSRDGGGRHDQHMGRIGTLTP